MRRIALFCLPGLALCLLFSTAAQAKKLNSADFPLRVHLFTHNDHSHYRSGMLDYAEGEGRANLYENGDPKAFDYSYRCGSRLMNSIGYETYMARWKKQDRSLEILLPVMGKPDAAETCEVKVDMKPGMAYYHHNGMVSEQPSAVRKQWMIEHQYDPEHGLNEPVPSKRPDAPQGQTAPPQNP
jgi:hypothetical protein